MRRILAISLAVLLALSLMTFGAAEQKEKVKLVLTAWGSTDEKEAITQA